MATNVDRFFGYKHLQEVSKPISELAELMNKAKDCFVRAAL